MGIGRRKWRAAAAVIAGSVSALLLGALAPATADTGTDDIRITGHGQELGSQIRAVEGDHSNSFTKRRALEPQGLNSDGAKAYATVPGIDVSGWQQNVDWAYWWGQGKRFAYVKATEGTSYKNPYFAQQYNGSYNIGMIRGAYHFALPNVSSGAAQANFFVDNGGGWSADGKTLPGVIDLEYNPYGDTCYGKTQSQMTAWILDFHDTYHARTGRWPVIYTSTSWWKQCVGTTGDFSSTAPLWIARYASSVGELPYNWSYHTFWQYTSTPIDQNSFNGSYERLQVLATG
ncbi:MAG: lysozyme [Saccharomonospora viridis]|jgi:GH25 family lysozyme M1 (1,4-beta-N-acetylmuramidase)|uniref:lysozyme n=2 Tax=Saccharomonospora viridis TaxID=1852 RepID=C7MRF2_SACVD|nr:lysozyme [Saccharomonospora viridis]ACU98738.1 lysozyme M1 (1,4-beta-N-acetylmuramidase) [Saccharomonospora viridis DSM 43017]KHF44532.1 lysozyme [Saccharomonospora viridis]SFP66742.1 lysozyme [Saccharomonospora viridis]